MSRERVAWAVACAFACVAAASRTAATEPGSTPTPAATGQLAALDEAVLALPQRWRDAYNGGDAAAVASLYAGDGYYLSAHVAAHGRDRIEAYFRKGIAAGGHVDAIRVFAGASSGELAYALGTYEATNAGQQVDGRIVLVLRRQAEGWLIVAHETVVRDQP